MADTVRQRTDDGGSSGEQSGSHFTWDSDLGKQQIGRSGGRDHKQAESSRSARQPWSTKVRNEL